MAVRQNNVLAAHDKPNISVNVTHPCPAVCIAVLLIHRLLFLFPLLAIPAVIVDQYVPPAPSSASRLPVTRGRRYVTAQGQPAPVEGGAHYNMHPGCSYALVAVLVILLGMSISNVGMIGVLVAAAVL